eukprot:FR734649.1.p1 GENE.FR734649.1~~FR734649.1.p1  ORF type:complete len:148 (+),score=9.49 FR734649.1:24-446(+)
MVRGFLHADPYFKFTIENPNIGNVILSNRGATFFDLPDVVDFIRDYNLHKCFITYCHFSRGPGFQKRFFKPTIILTNSKHVKEALQDCRCEIGKHTCGHTDFEEAVRSSSDNNAEIPKGLARVIAQAMSKEFPSLGDHSP